MTTPQLYHCLRYTDAAKAIEFLSAVGFEERLVVRDETDPSIVVHAQFQWRDNGGLMFGSIRGDVKDDVFRPGVGVANIVVESDEAVDALVERALEVGATLAQEPMNPPHGGRMAGVKDFDGNYWNIDSYPGV